MGKAIQSHDLAVFYDVWHEAILNQVHSFHLDVADDASATPAPHRTQSQVSGVPWGTGYFEECLVKGRCCTLRPTPVTKRNGTLPPAKIMRRFSQLTHGSLVPCVVQLCASRIRGDRSCRLRCCWRRKCYPSPPLYTKPSVWCAMGGRIL